MKRLAMLAMLVVCLGRVGAVDAVVTGSIFGPGSESFPIAVVPLKNLGGDADGSLGTRFARVLSRDLDLSGYFRLLDPKTFIEDPQTSGTTAADIDFVGWATIGAQALVKGTVNAAGDAVTVEVRLFDVPGRHDVPPAILALMRRASTSEASVSGENGSNGANAPPALRARTLSHLPGVPRPLMPNCES